MASNYSSFLIVVLAVFAAAALGQPIYNGLTVRGTLCCTPTGNCLGRPVANETVGVYKGPFQLGSNCTGDNGRVIINITRPRLTALEAADYMAIVKLPTSSRICPDLSVLHGRLTAPIKITGGAGGYLQGIITQFSVNSTQ